MTTNSQISMRAINSEKTITSRGSLIRCFGFTFVIILLLPCGALALNSDSIGENEMVSNLDDAGLTTLEILSGIDAGQYDSQFGICDSRTWLQEHVEVIDDGRSCVRITTKCIGVMLSNGKMAYRWFRTVVDC